MTQPVVRVALSAVLAGALLFVLGVGMVSLPAGVISAAALLVVFGIVILRGSRP